MKLGAVNHDNEPELEKLQKEIRCYWLDIKTHAKQNKGNNKLQRKSKMFHKQGLLLDNEICYFF